MRAAWLLGFCLSSLTALAADRSAASLRLEPAWEVSALGTPRYRVINGGTVPIYSDFVGRLERFGAGWEPFVRGETSGEQAPIRKLAPGAEVISREQAVGFARQFPPGRYRFCLRFGFSAKSAGRDVMSAEFEIR